MDKVVCPDCEGEGRLWDYEAANYPRPICCPKCQGAGTVKESDRD